jgi:hypothetical protein
LTLEDETDIEEPLSPALPLSSSPKKAGHHHSISARIQALTILDLRGVVPKVCDEIRDKTGISKSSVYRIREKVISRGWNPRGIRILDTHDVDDAPRSGRPNVTVYFILATVTWMVLC